MRPLQDAQDTIGRPGGQEASALGRTADWLAGVLQGGWDKVTRTTYEVQSWPRMPTRRETRASARLLQGQAARNAWERAMHDDAILCSEDGGKTWIDVRFDFDETRWPPIDRPGYQSPEQQERGLEPADSYPLATQDGRDFHAEIMQADQAEFEGELEAGA